MLHAARSDGVRATDAAVVKISRPSPPPLAGPVAPQARPLGAGSGGDSGARSRYLTRCVIDGMPSSGNATLVVRHGCDLLGTESCKFKVMGVTSC